MGGPFLAGPLIEKRWRWLVGGELAAPACEQGGGKSARMVERVDGRDVAPHPRVEPNVRMAGRLSVVEGFEGGVAGLPSFLVLDAADVLDAVREAVDARVERGRRVGC